MQTVLGIWQSKVALTRFK